MNKQLFLSVETIISTLEEFGYISTNNKILPYLEFISTNKSKLHLNTKYEQLLGNGQRIINVNCEQLNIQNYVYFGIKEDGGTRTSFNGVIKSIDQLKTLLEICG